MHPDPSTGPSHNRRAMSSTSEARSTHAAHQLAISLRRWAIGLSAAVALGRMGNLMAMMMMGRAPRMTQAIATGEGRGGTGVRLGPPPRPCSSQPNDKEALL